MHTYTFLFCQLRGPRSNNTPVAISTSGAQSLVSNTIPNKRNQTPWRMSDSRTGNIKDQNLF